MPRFRVVVADFLADALGPERDLLGDIADVVALNASDEAELVGHVETADAVMLFHCIVLTNRTISRLNQCKLIVRCGVGFDNIDARAARAKGIPLANVPDYGTEEVADSAIGLMLSLTRGINFFNNRLQRKVGDWAYMQGVPLMRLRGRVFGIIGLGRIGTAAAMRAKALGMDVAFYDPHKPDGHDKAIGVRRVEKLDDLFRQSFAVSVHCPLTDETRHIVDARGIELMPTGSYLVNTSRGATVDATAIPAAIRSGKLARRGDRRVAIRAAAGRPPAAGRVARPGRPVPRPRDSEPALRVLLGRGAARHAGEGRPGVSPRAARRTTAERGELKRRGEREWGRRGDKTDTVVLSPLLPHSLSPLLFRTHSAMNGFNSSVVSGRSKCAPMK